MAKRKRFPEIKKDIRDFIIAEEGKITKKDIAKVGLSLLVLSMMLQPEDAYPQHTNSFYSAGRGGHQSHNSHGSHGSHASHANALGVVVVAGVAVGVVAVDTVVADQ